MHEFIRTLEQEYEKHQNPTIALEQKAYMRHQFDFYGLKATERRAIQKPFLVAKYLPAKSDLHTLVKALWQKPQRDFQLFAQELVFKYCKQFEKGDIALLEYMVVHKSWWDTVDYIAYKLMGAYFVSFPEERQLYLDKWLASNNLWLQRSALLFQLKYKEELDTELLTTAINSLLGSKEFFINKAIGWILREYSRTNPQWVIDFVDQTVLNTLSKREALRLIM
ncbi:DNA alkylation repair protein [Carboxylicivirga marina]|uniref:DNA alkylation repair protein n=1 Tax=Carboxylicivirga marina TaxID=2800988 RepID=A0ABS1HFY5_9BACT|nr:DNA alkylation repair protein [Carboxylicivirga marina]MBK3516576.1 DNA alkylation repair protein [Carboxylicivirga marina]